MKNRWMRRGAVLVALCLVCSLTVLSGLAANIVELKVQESSITAHVKNAGEVSQVTAALGKTPLEQVSFQSLESAGLGMRTLILIDNSLSIPSASRPLISEEINKIINARKSGERFALGTISEDVVIVQDFTDDYGLLQQGLSSITYNDQETYLTDALYDYLVTGPFSGDNSFTRLLIFSDGVDNKDIGYTKDELIALLKSAPVPLNTVGVQNNTKSNSSNIENMFALARATGGGTYLLSDVQNDGSLNASLQGDWANQVVVMQLPEQLKDGSTQTLTLEMIAGEGASETLVLDGVRMPLTTQPPAPEPTPEPAPAPAPAPAPEPAPEPEPEPEPEPSFPLVPVLLGVLAVLAIAAVVVFLLLRRKKDENIRTIPQEDLEKRKKEESTSTVIVEGDGTEIVDDGTLHVWDEDRTVSIILTDVNDMSRRYKKPIADKGVLLVGRDSESVKCDIKLNDGSVSRPHCEIHREGDNYYLVNRSANNPTRLNGKPVTERTPVQDGCMLKLGRVELRLEIER